MTKTEATGIANRIMAQGHFDGGYSEGSKTRIYHVHMYEMDLDQNGGPEVRKFRIYATSTPKVREELVYRIQEFAEFGDFLNEVS